MFWPYLVSFVLRFFFKLFQPPQLGGSSFLEKADQTH